MQIMDGHPIDDDLRHQVRSDIDHDGRPDCPDCGTAAIPIAILRAIAVSRPYELYARRTC